jgi:hypothetical protein
MQQQKVKYNEQSGLNSPTDAQSSVMKLPEQEYPLTPHHLKPVTWWTRSHKSLVNTNLIKESNLVTYIKITLKS